MKLPPTYLQWHVNLEVDDFGLKEWVTARGTGGRNRRISTAIFKPHKMIFAGPVGN